MIRLEFHPDKCKPRCEVCETQHPGIRKLAGLDRGKFVLSMSEWEQVQETIRGAVSVCPSGAINWIDERGEWL